MRGFELRKARMDLRTQLRRDAATALVGGLALDREHMAVLAPLSNQSSKGNLMKDYLIAAGLTTAGYSAEEACQVMQLSLASYLRVKALAFQEPDGVAHAIDARVRERLPETPEPDRVAAPRGPFAGAVPAE